MSRGTYAARVLPDDDRALAHLDRVAHAAPADPDAALDALTWLGPQLDADRERGTFARWGRSTVVDENTGAPVLDPPVLHALQRRAGLAVEFPGANAGLAHVYGYLLSTAVTPYGLKRDRWTGGALAVALGLDGRAFLPWHRPDGRTLLERVTDAALPVLTAPDGPDRPGAPGAMLRRDDPVDGEVLRTVVRRVAATGPAALVYGWVAPGAPRLVTAFPVDAGVERVRELAALPPAPRYNVLVDGLR